MSFRQNLHKELLTIVDDDTMEAWQNEFPFADAKEEHLSQLADYYTPRLMKFEPFRREFTGDEIRRLEQLHHEAAKSEADWLAVQDRARQLLTAMEHADAPVAPAA